MSKLGLTTLGLTGVLRRDLDKLAIGESEVRTLVNTYYELQDYRKSLDSQTKELSKRDDPCAVVDYLGDVMTILEKCVIPRFRRYARENPLGQWCLNRKGIGPVLSAGLLAHIDLAQAPTHGSLWRFAGLDPSVTWERGEKRPWNAELKTLCWKIGESFVKVCGADDAFYGVLYRERKEIEVSRNEAGENEDAALQKAQELPHHKQVATYKKGKLPDGHVHARAKRWVVKMFLSHYHTVGFRLKGWEPPTPYPVEHQGHAHVIEPPGMDEVL